VTDAADASGAKSSARSILRKAPAGSVPQSSRSIVVDAVTTTPVPLVAEDELTTREAAGFLSVSSKTLGKYVRARILRRRDIAPPGSARPTWRYLVADLHRLKTQGYQFAHRQIPKPSKPKARPRLIQQDYSGHLDL
jgi:hypothetical protein